MNDKMVANAELTGANLAPAFDAPVDLTKSEPFALGSTQVEPRLHQVIYADGSGESLEPRVMEVLVALSRAHGAVVSRSDLATACWRGRVVGEDALQRVIQRLRKVAARSGSFEIETITKVGYRLSSPEADLGAARGDVPSLALLPFDVRSGGEGDDSFALGLVDDIIDALSEGVNVRVLAGSATARLRNSPPTDLAAAGKAMGVRYFLGGNFRRMGGQLMLTAHLIEAASEAIVWTQKFERPVGELAALETELVSELAAWLGATIFKLEMDRALRKPANLTAWECTARSMAAIREYGLEPLTRSIAEAQRAVDIAPDYGLARAYLALTVSGAYLSVSLHDPVQERDIRKHIERAFVLDPDNAAVLAAISCASAYIGRPADGLPRALKAIRLRRGHGLAHYAAGVNALLLSMESDAVVHLENFLTVEPESHLHYITHVWRGICHTRRGRFDAGRACFNESLTLFPTNFIAKLMLAAVDGHGGRAEAATQHLAEAFELEPTAGLPLYHARLDRFLAGSDLHQPLVDAVTEAWSTLR
ncbi:MAG: winged helix-turn-helix domain-containing protein [Novosphingobium sp.]